MDGWRERSGVVLAPRPLRTNGRRQRDGAVMMKYSSLMESSVKGYVRIRAMKSSELPMFSLLAAWPSAADGA
ncbi:hypothetical protein [Streptomyces sp. MA5143a]|uniref:hypothetical protein n=1 Tax=Streptomyces sp. MA5143a TaxID=2083010 RepID=UPI0011B2A07D|nr:hypothetical protein [Streptomyces sp. MA5143a]